jgi:hypothetical protein
MFNGRRQCGNRRVLGGAGLLVGLLATGACDRPDVAAPPPAPTAPAPAPAAGPRPEIVHFIVPAFIPRFGDGARLVDVTACRDTVCASASVMLGDDFSASLPTSTTPAEVTAHVNHGTGSLLVTLKVRDAGGPGASPARTLSLTVTPTMGDAGPRQPYLRQVLPGCQAHSPELQVVCGQIPSG